MKSSALAEPCGFWTIRQSVLWIVIPAIPVILWFLQLFHPDHGLAHAREGTAHSLISQLSQAAKSYELDYAAFPPGDGTGSRDLAIALQKKGAKQMRYFEFPQDPLMLTPAGDIRNPVNDEKILYYRCPGIHHPKTFDLWCADSKGKVDGINNWDP
jgi:hypothetical protein